MKKFYIWLFFCTIFLLSACQQSDSRQSLKEASVPKETLEMNMPESADMDPNEKRDTIESTSEETFNLNDHVQWKAEYFAQGMFHEDMILQRSLDGGKNWTKVGDNREKGSTLPAGAHTGLFFLDEKTGWSITSTPAEGDIGLYRTADGGFTWTHQKPSIPEAFNSEQFQTLTPYFFNPEYGVLVANNTSQKALILLTDDGGKNWAAAKNAKGQSGQMKWSFPQDDSDRSSAPWKITIQNKTWESSDGQYWTHN